MSQQSLVAVGVPIESNHEISPFSPRPKHPLVVAQARPARQVRFCSKNSGDQFSDQNSPKNTLGYLVLAAGARGMDLRARDLI